MLDALVAVRAYTLRAPAIGEVEALRLSWPWQRVVTVGGAALIGLYDGLVGPGTGSSLILLLVGAVGLSFLHARATSKVVHTMTNPAALLSPRAGHVPWGLGAAIAVSNLAGSQVGARLAVRRGSRWVRRVLLVVVGTLVRRLDRHVHRQGPGVSGDVNAGGSPGTVPAFDTSVRSLKPFSVTIK